MKVISEIARLRGVVSLSCEERREGGGPALASGRDTETRGAKASILDLDGIFERNYGIRGTFMISSAQNHGCNRDHATVNQPSCRFA